MESTLILGIPQMSTRPWHGREDPFGHIKEHFPRGLSFRLLTRGEMDIVFARVACGDYILREG
ncbi:hypothetical protein C360_04207 [Cryptococcus neoformans Bt15]|nr:hypothetical protein C360_04207 [Cryptococcus neoformans var. grubii Bt15]